jgi:Flp pilus assembly protein TadD
MFCAAAFAEARHAPRVEVVAAPAKSRAQPAQQNEGYVGSEACSRCHAEIYNHFARTSMGRSTEPVTPEFLRTVPLPASVYDQKFDRHFEVNAQDGKLYQSEYQLDASGHEVFRNTHAITWIVGTGMNGQSALTQRGDYVFEAPLSFYSKTGQWALSPGYQRGDYGFNRAVAPGCIFCHTGRPQPVSGSDGKYRNPAFTQLAIGCENCHGPGAAHVEAMGDGESFDKGKDPTIASPGEMKPIRANELCMSCHQTGDTRVFQPGKSYQDFRPGTPLNRVLAILMVPPTRDNPPREDHVEHYYSMILSKCYRGSANNPEEKQLRCVSCHDPHIEPTAAEAPAYFNGKCMSCHTQQSCKASVAARQKTEPTDNCIGCHMQKREGVAIAHTSITNHRIVARPDEAFPDAAFAMTTATLPDLIYLDASADQPMPPAVTLLQAYSQLKDQSPEYAASYAKTLSELEKSIPDNAVVQAALGHQALVANQWDEASQHLQQSLKLNPAQPAVYADLSEVAEQKGEAAEAVAMQQKAVLLDPYNAPLQKALVLRLIDAKQYPEAEAAMEGYLENFPEDDFMRKMLAIAKSP